MINRTLTIMLAIAGVLLLNTLAAHSQVCTPDQQLEPGRKCTPGPGFPGSTSNIQLHEAGVTLVVPTYYFPLIPAPYSGPYLPTAPNPNAPGGLPCPGDIVKNPKIAPTVGTNFAGGTYGLTRFNGTKFHDGVDIAAAPGTPIFSPENGIVTNVRGTFSPGQYASKSYGNYVQITYIVNGVTVTMSFNHMDGVQSGIVNNSPVSQGQLLGISGTTGNAGAPGINPHVHIRAMENGKSVDPQKYLKSNFDKNTGLPTKSPC